MGLWDLHGSKGREAGLVLTCFLSMGLDFRYDSNTCCCLCIEATVNLDHKMRILQAQH